MEIFWWFIYGSSLNVITSVFIKKGGNRRFDSRRWIRDVMTKKRLARRKSGVMRPKIPEFYGGKKRKEMIAPAESSGRAHSACVFISPTELASDLWYGSWSKWICVLSHQLRTAKNSTCSTICVLFLRFEKLEVLFLLDIFST